MEDWVTIRNLKAKNPKMGTRKIAEVLGISRNTVKKALMSDAAPQYQRKTEINPDLAPFESFIKEGYLIKHLKVSRILKDLRSKGYTGSKDALYRHINNVLKPEREAANTKAFKPYSTEPGEQMQYDWAEYVVPIGTESVKVYVHQTILGYSRYKFFDSSISINQSDVFQALHESFVHFGGVCERLQVDNARVFVHNAGKERFEWNRRFLHFCGFYGIKPTRSLPYHPWSKGKVEKPFDYLETHFIAGNTFESFQQFRERLAQFTEEVNANLHSVLKSTPVKMHGTELAALKPLPIDHLSGEIKGYVGFKEEFRKVSSDCMIAYQGNRYSVPHHFATREVWVRVLYGTTLQVYSSQNRLIASHPLCLKKGEVILDSSHFKGYRKESTPSFTLSSDALRRRFSHYTHLLRFIEHLKVQKRINPAHHLQKIVSLFEYYDDAACIEAMEECFTYNMFNATLIKGFLQQQPQREEEPSLPGLFQTILPQEKVKRDLEEYALTEQASTSQDSSSESELEGLMGGGES